MDPLGARASGRVRGAAAAAVIACAGGLWWLLGIAACSSEDAPAEPPARPGVEATVSLLDCVSPGAGEASHMPMASARYRAGRVVLRLSGYNVGSCGSGAVDVRAVRRDSSVELVTYRTDRGGCVMRCDLEISAPMTLEPGRYQVRVRRGGRYWLMSPVQKQSLVVRR